MEFSNRKVIVVSNRLPIAIFKNEAGNWEVRPGTGGLVTALQPIVRKSNGLWIGWSGYSENAPSDKLLADYSKKNNFKLVAVKITEKEISQYYRGFSNKSIWPLFHDMLGQFSFNLSDLNVYEKVNKKFAEKVVEYTSENDTIWVHDYQLIYVGKYLRELGMRRNLNFFLHIPFPSYDLFRRFPRNRNMIEAFLSYNHIGFQTALDRRNFISSVKWLLPDALHMASRRQTLIQHEGRETLVGYYPISIDFDEFKDGSKTREASDAAWYLRENIKVDVLALGLDRLDYTKGIPERFLAFERLLEKYPATKEKISLLQIVIPSRLNVPEYQKLKDELDYMVGRINSRFSTQGWVPIYYQFRTLNRVQLLGHYKASDIALITPLRDGMNLISKEFCAASTDNRGIVILSEFAGASAQLSKGALMVNPYDFDQTADALYQAFNMTDEEKTRRMRIMRSDIRRNDLHRWVRWFFREEYRQ
jgi:trehalose 6-phosphate synthase